MDSTGLTQAGAYARITEPRVLEIGRIHWGLIGETHARGAHGDFGRPSGVIPPDCQLLSLRESANSLHAPAEDDRERRQAISNEHLYLSLEGSPAFALGVQTLAADI